MRSRQKVNKRDGLWHPYFAWFPIRTTDGYLVWLEEVERRMYAYYDGPFLRVDWQYQTLYP